MKANIVVEVKKEAGEEYEIHKVETIEIDHVLYDPIQIANHFQETNLGKLSPHDCVAAIYQKLCSIDEKIANLEDKIEDKSC